MKFRLIILLISLSMLCPFVKLSYAGCRVIGKMRAMVHEDKWLGFAGKVTSYTITSVIKDGERYQIPQYFPYVDRKTTNRYGEDICIVNARILDFTGIADGDSEEVYITPKEVIFKCICTD